MRASRGMGVIMPKKCCSKVLSGPTAPKKRKAKSCGCSHKGKR